MKKLGLMMLVAGIILMAGCAGDDPAGGGGGTLEVVTGVAIGSASIGRDVVITWNVVSDVDGYYVYFRETVSAEWGTAVGDVTTNTYTHTADVAGYYVVVAYEGSNTSSANSAEVTTMPNQIAANYTIWDNHAPTDSTSGFYFEADAGYRVLAASSTLHDIYCFDGNWTQSPCGFYSGDKTPFGGGNPTSMKLAGTTYAYPPSTGWWDSNYILSGDVIFAELEDGHYVKIYVFAVPQCPAQPLSYGVSFFFDYQPIEGLYLFTNESE